MIVKKIVADKKEKLSSCISKSISDLSFDYIKKIIRSKDVKVNSKRVSQDVDLCENDVVEVYYKENLPFKTIYEDDNVLIVFKSRKIEVVSEDNDCLIEKLKAYYKQDFYAVHRLDRNTTGLVVFAKNLESKNELDLAFKNRTIDKFYYALVCGNVSKEKETLTAYLKKDINSATVFISKKEQSGYEKIITKYELVKNFEDNLSLLSVELVTGKTHQIRAHLASVGYPILGDEKYGNEFMNKKHGLHFQCLCSYKIIFHFEKNCKLSYLDCKTIEILSKDVDFLKFYK